MQQAQETSILNVVSRKTRKKDQLGSSRCRLEDDIKIIGGSGLGSCGSSQRAVMDF
jgi:hypothetical protein